MLYSLDGRVPVVNNSVIPAIDITEHVLQLPRRRSWLLKRRLVVLFKGIMAIDIHLQVVLGDSGRLMIVETGGTRILAR